MDAGAHYGHQTQRWNPKMLPFIYGARNGVHIINLDLTMKKWEIARKYILDRIALGGNILFVGNTFLTSSFTFFHNLQTRFESINC